MSEALSAPATKGRSLWADAWNRLKANRAAMGASQYALRNDKDRRYSTAIGAVAGALVGEAIQQNTSGVARSGQPFYRMTVRLDSGETRTFD